MSKEEKGGDVGMSMYAEYARQGGGIGFGLIIFFLYVFVQGIRVGTGMYF